MFPLRNNLFIQLHSAFERNWQDAADTSRPSSISQAGEMDRELNIGSYSSTANASTLGWLRQRIEELEMRNDQLYQYLVFLVDNLPDLILRTTHADIELNHVLELAKTGGQLKGVNEAQQGAAREAPSPTPREKDILRLLERGYCAKEIANQLCVSETTVISHKRNLKRKFKVKNTAELISRVKSLV